MASLVTSHPLLPGRGAGNALAWPDGPPRDRAELERAAWEALVAYLSERRGELGVDPAELAAPRIAVHDDGELLQIRADRQIAGMPVHGSALTAVIRQGNLTLLGTRHWGDVLASHEPRVSAAEAASAVRRHLAPFAMGEAWREPALELVPVARGHDPRLVPVGQGYDHRLAWRIHPRVEGEAGGWVAQVDALSGELLSLEDAHAYATTRRVVGGVYPEANDGVGPGGTEQAGWPMPFADVASSDGIESTDSGGNLVRCVEGAVLTELAGPFVRIHDACGAVGGVGSPDVDLGTSGGIDCETPTGSAFPGNTHASRTTFYELNRCMELARGQLPGNPWLSQQLQAHVNTALTCNARFDTVTGAVEFAGYYGVACNNLGELAGIVAHEWGHAMDHNDATPGLSNPSEGIADVYAALRSGESCIGRGFVPGFDCGGFGDPCTQCDGVRDIDWANRASGVPHDLAWIDAACSLGKAPCGGNDHCEGAVVSEAVWDLWKRDLAAPPFSLDSNTALEIVTRLAFLGGGAVGFWYDCVNGTGTGDGCNADGGYLNFLAADDDNGDLTDGTPHMRAIHDAFDRHGIACPTPTPQNAGCEGAPTSAPAVAVAPIDRGAVIIWNPVAGATRYDVFRGDGLSACDAGKVRVGGTTATSFTDTGLQNGRDYSYVVVPIGPADSCLGPASACADVVPSDGANLAVASPTLAILSGDGDEFLEDGEVGELGFDVVSVGSGVQTGVQVLAVTPISHPGMSVGGPVTPAMAGGGLAECEAAGSAAAFTASGLATPDTVVLSVQLTSDQLSPLVVSQQVEVSTLVPVPEPAEVLLLAAGIAGLAALGRRRIRP